MGQVTGEVVLDAGVKKVWEFITEPDNFSDYVHGYDGGKVITENATGLDSAFEWYGRFGPIKLKSAERVVEWKNNERVGYKGSMVGVKFNSAMSVEKAGQGKTRLLIDINYKVPPLLGGKVAEQLLLKWLVREYIDESINKLSGIFGT